MLGDVGGGDLEAVEQEAGAAGVDVVSGEGAHDLFEGGLDVGAGAESLEGDGVVAGAAGADLVGRSAELAVEVAEGGSAEGGAAAARASGHGVAAAGAVLRVFEVGDHLSGIHWDPLGYFVGKIFKTLGLGRGYLSPSRRL